MRIVHVLIRSDSFVRLTIFTSPPSPVGLQSTAINVSVCLSVWPHISKNKHQNFTQFSVYTCCRWPQIGPLLTAMQQAYMYICTAGFVYDVIMKRIGQNQ